MNEEEYKKMNWKNSLSIFEQDLEKYQRYLEVLEIQQTARVVVDGLEKMIIISKRQLGISAEEIYAQHKVGGQK